MTRASIVQVPKQVVNLRHRPGTDDEKIIKDVLIDNEYDLPDAFNSWDVIVDVGAHIGAFAMACYARHPGRIFSYECDPANYALLRANLKQLYPICVIRNWAIWRSDRIDAVSFTGYPEGMTGRGSCLAGVNCNGVNQEIPVKTKRFDEIIDMAASEHGRVRLVKLDCEGSEFPILYTSERLQVIDEIVGELHVLYGEPHKKNQVRGREFSADGIRTHLKKHGFQVRMRQQQQGVAGEMWWFWAKR